MRKLFETTTDQIQSGLAPGLLPPQVPLWISGSNVKFSNASVANRPASESKVDLSSPALDIRQAYVGSRRRLYIGTAGNYYEWEEAGSVRTTLYTGVSSDWYSVPWGSWVIATNNNAKPQIWKNTGAMSDLAGTTFTTAAIMEKYNSYLCAYNTSNGDTRVDWCSLDDPETWDPLPDNTAGYFDIRDLDSGIQAVAPLGSAMAIYSSGSQYIQRFLSNSLVFSFKPGVSGVGAVSKHSVVSFGSYNWGITKRGVWQTDGIQVAYLDEPTFRRWLEANVNWTRPGDIRGWHDETNQDISWVVPVGASSLATVAVNRLTGAWSFGDSRATNGLEEQVFDGTILGFSNGIYITGYGTTSGTLASEVQTKPMDFGDREITKQVEMIRLNGTWSGTVQVGIAFTNDLSDTPTFVPYDIAETIDLLPGLQEGNYVHLKIVGAANSIWRIGGFSIHGEATRYAA